MWHRFGHGFSEAVLRAAADADGARDLSTRHLLRALVGAADAPAGRVLARLGVTPEAVRDALDRSDASEAPAGPESFAGGPTPGLTPAARAAVERAYALAAAWDDVYIGGEHLLMALVQEPGGSHAGCALARTGVDWARAGQALMAQQTWRTRPPAGIRVPGLSARRLTHRARAGAGRLKRLAGGLARTHEPYLPYLLFRERTVANPYPFYARLRRTPCYWDARIGQWVVTGYAAVAAALAEPRFSHRTYTPSAWGRDDPPPLVDREFRRLDRSLARQMLFLDSPDHLRRRSLVSRQFTPRVIARMRGQMQQVTDDLLDALAPAGRMDAVTDLGFPMPMTIIARMLGVPAAEAAQFKAWSNDFITYLGGDATLAQDLAAYHSLHALTAYFGALIPQRRCAPQEDLLTLLVQAEDAEGGLTDEEIVANCLLLLAAGHENTTRMLGNGLAALLDRPDQWRRLCDDPAVLGTAVEEVLRFDSPVQWTTRVAAETMEWRGHAIQKGQMIRLGLAAANRDPEQFADPDRLDVARTPNRHLAFGGGPHFCLGAALTRLEAEVLLGTLAARFPRLRLAGLPVRPTGNFTFRDILALPVRWD